MPPFFTRYMRTCFSAFDCVQYQHLMCILCIHKSCHIVRQMRIIAFEAWNGCICCVSVHNTNVVNSHTSNARIFLRIWLFALLEFAVYPLYLARMSRIKKNTSEVDSSAGDKPIWLFSLWLSTIEFATNQFLPIASYSRLASMLHRVPGKYLSLWFSSQLNLSNCNHTQNTARRSPPPTSVVLTNGHIRHVPRIFFRGPMQLWLWHIYETNYVIYLVLLHNTNSSIAKP